MPPPSSVQKKWCRACLPANWEEQVQDAIDEVVKTRRDEIDWVLTDKTHQPGSDISPEALKSRLTERYFTDFGNAWLNMVNSIQWHEAASLSDAIAQLNLIGDVRQSPLVALMNTGMAGKNRREGGSAGGFDSGFGEKAGWPEKEREAVYRTGAGTARSAGRCVWSADGIHGGKRGNRT